MESSNFYTDCFFDDGYIFVKLKYEICGINKFVLEVGKINEDNIFSLKYFLIYDTENNFHEHFLEVVSQTGVKDFFNNLSFEGKFFLDIDNLKGEKIGEIRPYNKDSDDILNQSNISEYKQHIPQNDYIPIKEKFTEAPKIGLQNVGATCYMNATIQCLCQIEKLVDHFKSNQEIDKIIKSYKDNNKDCLTKSFKNLIENLWPTDKKFYDKKYNFENSNNKYFVP